MIIEEALVQLLKADTAVSAIIGTKLYPQEAYQDDETPLILYATSDPEQTMSVSGYINMYTANFRFDCYGQAPAYSSAKSIAKAVRDCLFGFLRGTVTAQDASTITIMGIFDGGGDDNIDPPVHGEERGIDYVGVSIQVIYRLN